MTKPLRRRRVVLMQKGYIARLFSGGLSFVDIAKKLHARRLDVEDAVRRYMRLSRRGA